MSEAAQFKIAVDFKEEPDKGPDEKPLRSLITYELPRKYDIGGTSNNIYTVNQGGTVKSLRCSSRGHL